jgi:menaquinone-dependent protoporphyrinogen IX oxidase
MRHGGHETDTAQDYEYTDWEAVERFAADFATRC